MPKHPYPKHPNKSEREVKTMEINKNKEIYRSDQRNEIDNLYFHPHGTVVHMITDDQISYHK